VIFGAMSIGQCGPNLAAVAEAKGAAAKLIEIVLRQPAIDSASDDGLRLKAVQGAISFENISFRYPARPEVQVSHLSTPPWMGESCRRWLT
jgi:ATP-binding cassette, subfamily B (MDR/TAP), member 1